MGRFPCQCPLRPSRVIVVYPRTPLRPDGCIRRAAVNMPVRRSVTVLSYSVVTLAAEMPHLDKSAFGSPATLSGRRLNYLLSPMHSRYLKVLVVRVKWVQERVLYMSFDLDEALDRVEQARDSSEDTSEECQNCKKPKEKRSEMTKIEDSGHTPGGNSKTRKNWTTTVCPKCGNVYDKRRCST